MEAPEVSEFRQCILDASWEQAEASLIGLGVSDEQALVVSTMYHWPHLQMSDDGLL